MSKLNLLPVIIALAPADCGKTAELAKRLEPSMAKAVVEAKPVTKRRLANEVGKVIRLSEKIVNCSETNAAKK